MKYICCDCKKETRCLLDWGKKLYCTKCKGHEVMTITQEQESALRAWISDSEEVEQLRARTAELEAERIEADAMLQIYISKFGELPPIQEKDEA